jgi:hypothetical protein
MASSSSSHQNTTVSAEAMMKPPSPSPNSGNVVGEITVQHNSNSPQQVTHRDIYKFMRNYSKKLYENDVILTY